MAGVGQGRVEAGGERHAPSSARFGLCPPQFLAMVFQDLLTSKDDYLRASRALLREIIKQTKHEINFQAFCLGLMQERKEPQYLDMEFKVRGCPLVPCAVHWALLGSPCGQRSVPDISGAPSCKRPRGVSSCRAGRGGGVRVVSGRARGAKGTERKPG